MSAKIKKVIGASLIVASLVWLTLIICTAVIMASEGLVEEWGALVWTITWSIMSAPGIICLIAAILLIRSAARKSTDRKPAAQLKASIPEHNATESDAAPKAARTREGNQALVKWSQPHEFDERFEFGHSVFNLKYQYADVYVAGVQYRNIDYKQLTPSRVKLVRETDNEYDSNAIAVVSDGQHIGYIGKGRMQDMVNDYLDQSGKLVMAWVSSVDEESAKVLLSAAFYSITEMEPSSVVNCKLAKLGKRDESGATRRENLEMLDNGEELSVVEDFNSDFEPIYVVIGGHGFDVGELPESVVSKIEGSGLDACLDIKIILKDAETGKIEVRFYG